MKQIKNIVVVIVGSLMGLFSCQNTDSFAYETAPTVDANEYHDEDPINQNIVVKVKRTQPSVLPPQPTLEEAAFPEIATLPEPPIDSPMVYAQNVFDDNIAVAPWRANYVGSYGVLPSRYQAEGPFLYSFDISPNADILWDDDADPIYPEELFWLGDDDDF